MKEEQRGLTCTHVLDLASHAHDQASVRKTLDELPASAFIFGGRNARSEFSWFDCALKCQKMCQRVSRARGLTEMGMGFRCGLANSGRLGDEMMGMHLSSVCAVSRKTSCIALHESERTRTQRHVLAAPVTRPMPATSLTVNGFVVNIID